MKKAERIQRIKQINIIFKKPKTRKRTKKYEIRDAKVL